MFCRKCGAQVSANERFCAECGEILIPVDTQEPASAPVTPTTVPAKASEKNNGLIAIIIVLVVALVAVAAVLGFYIYNSNKPDTENAGSTPVINEEPIENDEPEKTEPAKEPEKEEKIGKTDNRGKKRQEFLDTAREIENYEDDAWDAAQTQAEINTEAYTIYTKWDNLLNEVYQYLKSILPEDEFEALRQDELNWIENKEVAMDEAASEWEGGSGEPMAYYGKGAEWTCERCYELIYMID